jgi:vacuolar-type H+-ATPase subunit H|tara:strand:- start:21 stop:209 length:189 start_codon:yes stop_codon:yes gene_type:complete
MTATEEALAAMAKAEEAWNKMVDETVEVSGQFVEDCKAFQKECQEAFADVPEQPKQDPKFLA